MIEHPEKPVFSRPPVDGTDDELDHWAEGFVDAVLGSTQPDEKGLGSPQDKDDLGPQIDPAGGPPDEGSSASQRRTTMNTRTDVPDIPGFPVLGHPPVDGTDDGLDEWVKAAPTRLRGRSPWRSPPVRAEGALRACALPEAPWGSISFTIVRF